MTHREAAEMLGMSVKQIPKLIRDGLLDRVKKQYPSLSRTRVEEQARNPRPTEWVNVTEAAQILDLPKTRVGQISNKGLLPFEITASGRRRFRCTQIEVISPARQVQWHAAVLPVANKET
ncbi:MAG: hypothetical protein H7288_02115 [Kineosporiaceae bacterium]|nr:hypothetical protein [Aeromicrobium sp.]